MSKRGGSGLNFSGFSFKNAGSGSRGAAIPPPPPNVGVSKQGYSTMTAITQNALSASWGIPKKRTRTEEEYFDEEDEPSSMSKLEYIPAPGSPSYKGNNASADTDSDEDPLDAFMKGIDKEVKQEAKGVKTKKIEEVKGIRDDIDHEDDEESYYRYMEENPNAGLQDNDSDVDLEYDEDGNPIAPKKSKYIDPLPPIDHSTIVYEEVEKNFYQPHEDIARLTPQEAQELRAKSGITVSGADPPYPVSSFGHFGFDEVLMKALRKCEYTSPTPIQAQAVPAALSGRDIIGVAKTGSGKTGAFIWPMLVHIMDQKELEPGDGPMGLILAPTRELSQQIYNEAKRFGKGYNLSVVCCYGGGSKWDQSKALELGAEIVVGTPGRIIDMVKMGATKLNRVTFLVLDEADRMFDMGFEPQVRSICDHVRPNRQTLLFSATFKKRIEKLARDVLTDPIKIVQGDIGEANTDITQVVINLPQTQKLTWLTHNLVEFLSTGSLLIFVTKKLNAEELANSLTVKEYDVLLLHGDMDQSERNSVITKFKRQECRILVATDVAARGLDIPHIRTVVNYDLARDIDTHTHRIGRTGRAGNKGVAYTLVTDKDKEFAGHLVRNLEGANQEVPPALMNLAMQSSWFRKSRFKGGKGKSANTGGKGFGFRERDRPGLGSDDIEEPSSRGSSGAASGDVMGSLGNMSKMGPGQGRLAAMKAAFKAQYQAQFKASEDHTWEQTRDTPAPSTSYPPPSYNCPPPPPVAAPSEVSPSPSNREKKKKSRWDK
ncbi:ATP-dependent RNA helicase DDX42 [Diaphorina citri]|uniref:ATP-dependent RNA helicase DDX42 n=1 Tax=Diaphorina citri TaxID=121845 RepID=A0A1S3DMC0_DIACI|nr:ATP-dependent RNA helicase DDX42 [Diaphorina citri]